MEEITLIVCVVCLVVEFWIWKKVSDVDTTFYLWCKRDEDSAYDDCNDQEPIK